MSSAGTDAEQQLCSGFGFYLQVGGAARKSPERGESAGSVHVEREKTVCVREIEKKKWKNHSWSCVFAALESY